MSIGLSTNLNNARLLPMALYDGRVPAFRGLYTECDADLECFYREAIAISKLKRAERDARLDELQQQDDGAPVSGTD